MFIQDFYSPFRLHPTKTCFEGRLKFQIWLEVRAIGSEFAAEYENVPHEPAQNP